LYFLKTRSKRNRVIKRVDGFYKSRMFRIFPCTAHDNRKDFGNGSTRVRLKRVRSHTQCSLLLSICSRAHQTLYDSRCQHWHLPIDNYWAATHTRSLHECPAESNAGINRTYRTEIRYSRAADPKCHLHWSFLNYYTNRKRVRPN